jgi:hypothetical protein
MGNTESFVVTPLPPQVPREYYALNVGEAKEALEQAEAQDNYRWKCASCAANTAARRLMDYSPRAPEADLQYKMMVAGEAMPVWLKRGMPVRLRVATLANSADGGMPHTRPGALVCLPQYFQLDGAIGQTTFTHECIHVHQREHAAAWNRLYADVWGMEPYDGEIPAEIGGRRRFNPDTLWAGLYMWQRRWVAVPVYNRPDSPKLGAIKVVWYNVESGEWQSFAPPEFEADFGALTASEQEHPNELAAYWLSQPAMGSIAPARARMEAAVKELAR